MASANLFNVEVTMQSRSGVSSNLTRSGVLQSPMAMSCRGDAELAAIALLCLLFAWPPGEPRPQLRLVSE